MLVTDGFNNYHAIQAGKVPPQVVDPTSVRVEPTDWILNRTDGSLPPKIVTDEVFKKRFRIVGNDVQEFPPTVTHGITATDEVVVYSEIYPWERRSGGRGAKKLPDGSIHYSE